MIVGRNELEVGFSTPTDYTAEEPEEKKLSTFGETLLMVAKSNILPLHNEIQGLKNSKATWAYLRRFNEGINAFSFLKNVIKPLMVPLPMDQPFEVQVDDLLHFPEKHWPYLLDSINTEDLESRKNKLNREYNDIRLINTLGTFEKLLLGATNMAISPSTYLSGGLTAFRGAIQGATVLQSAYNVAKAVAPKVALSSAITNLPSYLNRPTISEEDYLLGTLVNAVVAGAAYGLGGAGQHALQSNVRVAMVADYKYNPNVTHVVSGKTGKMTGAHVHFTDENGMVTTSSTPAKTTAVNVPSIPTREDLLAQLAAQAEKMKANGVTMEELELIHNEANKLLGQAKEETIPLTPSEKLHQQATALLQENSNLSNLTEEQILTLTENELSQYYKHNINGVNDTFMKTFGFAALPVVKGLTSPFPVVKEFTQKLFGSNFIISNMTHPDIQEVEKKIFAIKNRIKKVAITSPSDKEYLQAELASLKAERKEVIQRLDREGLLYSGTPENLPSAQREAAVWVNDFHFLMYEFRQDYLKYIGLGDIETNLPFVDLYAKAKQVLTHSNKGRTATQQALDSALHQAYASGDVQTIMDIHKNPDFEAGDAILSWEDMGKEVCYALRRNEQSRIPLAAETARKLRQKIFNPLLKRARELNVLPEYMDDSTAISYLCRVMDKEKLTDIGRENLIKRLTIYANGLNMKTSAIRKPIEDIIKEAKDTQIQIKDEIAKGDKKDKLLLHSLMNKLQSARKQKIRLRDELQQKIDTGTLDLTKDEVDNYGLTQASLIDSRFSLTAVQKKEYDELTKDLDTAREDLAQLKKNALAEEMKLLGEEIKQELTSISNEIKKEKNSLKKKEAKQRFIITKDYTQKINTLNKELEIDLKKIDKDNKQEMKSLQQQVKEEYARLNKSQRINITEKNKQIVEQQIKEYASTIDVLEKKINELPKITNQLIKDITSSTKKRIKELEATAKELHKDIQDETNTKITNLENAKRKELDFLDMQEKEDIATLNATAKDTQKKTKEEILAEQNNLKQQIKLHKQEIQRKLDAGEVSEDLYTINNAGKKVLKKLNKTPLKQIAGKIKQPAIYAENVVDTWKGHNESQMSGEMFGAIRRGGGVPKSTKTRTALCTDYWIEDYFLNDPQMIIGSYVANMSNYLALENLFQQYGEKLGVKGKVTADNGETYLVKELKQSYQLKRQEIISKYSKLEKENYQREINKTLTNQQNRKKELTDLDNLFKEYKTFIKESLQIYRGDYGTPTSDAGHKAAEYSRNLTRYASATMLGGTVLMMVGDMIMPMFKSGPWRHIVDGLIPMVGSLLMHPLTATDAFKDANVGISMASSSSRARVFGEISQQNFRSSRRASIIFENASKFGMNASLLAPVVDFCETAAGFTASARLIRLIDKYFSKGSLVTNSNGKQVWASSARFSRKDLEWLQSTGFDINKYGERVRKMLEKYKEKRWTGYIPHESKWTDLEAAQHFRMFITKEVDATQNRSGKGDKPYWTQSPIGRILAQFQSWFFGATNNFTIPLIQRPDMEKIIWAMLSLAAAAVVGPLRDMAAGRKPDLSAKKLWIEALAGSGIGGYQLDLIIKMNALLKNPWGVMPGRYDRKTFTGMAFGAGGGILDTAFSLASAVAKGNINNKVGRKAIKMIPGMETVYTKQALNEIFGTEPE